jgi:hypothetical protein
MNTKSDSESAGVMSKDELVTEIEAALTDSPSQWRYAIERLYATSENLRDDLGIYQMLYSQAEAENDQYAIRLREAEAERDELLTWKQNVSTEIASRVDTLTAENNALRVQAKTAADQFHALEDELNELRARLSADTARIEPHAWLQPETGNSAWPDDMARCRETHPEEYTDWYPVYTYAKDDPEDEADMFWDDSDPEMASDSIIEILSLNYDPGDVVTIQRAIRLPNVTVRLIEVEQEGANPDMDYEVIDPRIARDFAIKGSTQ